MAGEVIVDALPYIDQGYDEPGVREAVNNKSCNPFLSLNKINNVIIEGCTPPRGCKINSRISSL